jgi:hypothetical protein
LKKLPIWKAAGQVTKGILMNIDVMLILEYDGETVELFTNPESVASLKGKSGGYVVDLLKLAGSSALAEGFTEGAFSQKGLPGYAFGGGTHALYVWALYHPDGHVLTVELWKVDVGDVYPHRFRFIELYANEAELEAKLEPYRMYPFTRSSIRPFLVESILRPQNESS